MNASLTYITSGNVLYRTAQLHRVILEMASGPILKKQPWFMKLWFEYIDTYFPELLPEEVGHASNLWWRQDTSTTIMDIGAPSYWDAIQDGLTNEIDRQDRRPQDHILTIDDVELGHASIVAANFRAWYKTMRKTQPRGWRGRL